MWKVMTDVYLGQKLLFYACKLKYLKSNLCLFKMKFSHGLFKNDRWIFDIHDRYVSRAM